MTYKHEAEFPPVIWALVADRAQACLYSADWPAGKSWNKVTEFTCHEGEQLGKDVYTDGPGTFAESAGGHHGGEPKTDFRHLTAQHFSRELAEYLEAARNERQFGKLILVAAPLLLGELRKHLTNPLAKMKLLDIDKDITALPVREI